MVWWKQNKTEQRASNPEEDLKAFIAKAPTAKYTFDSERGAPESELCRQPDGNVSKECRMIHMKSTRLFEAMQNLGFYCALPLNPGKTHMECIPMPKELD
ncbi:SubName: Full=Uncharacterized protein {ECO:0000313/EMBL:CCA73265.1} [Serendipita indica DSM 11827]|nr:SubName: Full=Uncharacterized protein {ECO:0000313/EMBL:CCA73265.1} [Serendipita indica DSM 11827]